MNAGELKHGKAYDCAMDGNSGIEKTTIVPLAADTKTTQRYVINWAKELYKSNPGLFRRLIEMSFQDIVNEDLPGGPYRPWSKHLWKFEINENGFLYYKDYDCYLKDFVEIEI